MNKNYLWILAIGLIVLMLVMNKPSDTPKEMKKLAGPGGVVITRTVSPSYVLGGQTFTIRYTFSSFTSNYGGILTESIPTGFTINTASFLNTMDVFSKKVTGQLIEMPFTGTANGQYIQFTITAGTSSGTLSGGKVDWSSGAGTETLPSANLQVCLNHNSFSCSSGNVYYYDSCSHIQEVKETCTANACGAWAADTCSGLTVQHSRTCYTVSCPTTACQQNAYTDTQTVTSAAHSTNGLCTWQCSSGICQQNTPADTSYNGKVENSELLTYITLWVSNSVTNPQLLDAITVWVTS